MIANKSFNNLVSTYNTKITLVAFFASILIFICLLVFRTLLIFTYSGEIGGIDNNFAYAVTRAIAGYNIYPDPASPPYAVNPYSPLYYNLCTLIGDILSINIEEPINVYRLCRSVSLICDILSCIVFFQTIRRTIVTRKEIAFLATSVFACLLCYLGYTFSRADSLFLLFYVLLISALLKRDTGGGIFYVLKLALLSAGCILSKQNGIITPVLVVAVLLTDKKNRLLLWYLLFFSALLVLAVFLYINILKYSHLLSHTVSAINNHLSLSWFYVTIFKRLSDSLLIVILYAGLVLSLRNLFGQPVSVPKNLGRLFILQTLFSLAISLKWGSSIGYFNESFVLAIFIICSYVTEKDEVITRKWLPVVLPLFILFTIHVLAQGYLFFIQDQKEKKEIYLQQKEIRDYLQPKLSGNYVLDLGNENGNFFKTLFYKESFVPNYDAISCCTFPRKTFNYSAMLNDLQNGKVKYLIRPETEIIPEIWGVSLEKFQKDTSLYGHTILSYRPGNDQ